MFYSLTLQLRENMFALLLFQVNVMYYFLFKKKILWGLHAGPHNVKNVRFCSHCICVCVCVCVWACVRACVHAYEDTNLYNDMGMTWVLQREGDLWGHFQWPHNSKRLEIIQSEFFGGKVEMHRLLWGLSLGVG